ncbi:MAG: hypothetical protein L0177_05705 [Chloroflexi bacterium]|nr:hypothetical protein [Chloroflexota bacterium]
MTQERLSRLEASEKGTHARLDSIDKRLDDVYGLLKVMLGAIFGLYALAVGILLAVLTTS